MSLVVPNVSEELIAQLFLADALLLKLYSNDKVPGETDIASDYTVVSGGGYVTKTLSSDNWTITPGAPTVALYATQYFQFTGPTSSPSVIYGYFVVDSNGILRWAERFSESVVPFTPINGAMILVTPRFEVN